jgi:hypothetical protein
VERVLAQLDDLRVHARRRVGRDEDLAAVARVRDPRGAMDVEPDQVLAVLARDARVESHADADGRAVQPTARLEAALRVDRGVHGRLRIVEDREGLVRPRLDHPAARVGDGAAHDRARDGEDGAEALVSERGDEAGRVLDVREQKSHLSFGHDSGSIVHLAWPG